MDQVYFIVSDYGDQFLFTAASVQSVAQHFHCGGWVRFHQINAQYARLVCDKCAFTRVIPADISMPADLAKVDGFTLMTKSAGGAIGEVSECSPGAAA